MKKALITGGAGFIGRHLCKRLLLEGYKVIAVDNLYTGNLKNIEEFKENKNFEFVNHDITLPLKIEVDEIYNLACPASPIHYQKDPIFTFKTSVIGTLNMLELAKANNAKILHASTSEVYGDPLQHPQKEIYWGNVNPIGIRSCYDEGKRAAECLCADYFRAFNINIKIIRIFNTYGPFMDPKDGRVVSNFIVSAIKNKEITIYGDGKQTRSFQYVSDLIEGIIAYMNLNEIFIGPINLGNPDEFTILELAEKIKYLLPESKSNLTFKPLPEDDPKRRRPNTDLASEKLSWSPKIHLEEGLKKTVEYFKSTI